MAEERPDRPDGPDRAGGPAERGQRGHREPERDTRTGRSAAAERIRHQTQWVEQQLRVAQERGDFDDLPGYGKPLELPEEHDPDWWVKKLVERERLSVLPPALALRKEDAELDERLDRLGSEAEVRRAVEDFNARVRHALYTSLGGPPVVTAPRHLDEEVQRWRARRDARRARSAGTGGAAEEPRPRTRPWRRRRR